MDGFVEKVFVTGGCPIHYWVGGKEDAPWLIFMHGACVDHHSFDPILPAFAGEYRILAWDARGHGLSQPMGALFTVPLAVEDLVAIMSQEKIERPTLIGHSNGTYIAQEMVFRYPAKVGALVVMDGTCITWLRSKFELWYVKAAIGAFDWWPYENLKKSSLKFASRIKASQEYEYRAFSMLSRRDFVAIMKGISLCLHPEPGYRIRCPLMILHGDDDRMGDIVKISPLWAQQDAKYVYRVIPNAGHMVTLDNPGGVNAALEDFLHSEVAHHNEENPNGA